MSDVFPLSLFYVIQRQRAGMYVTDISHPLNSARTRAPMQMGMSAGLLIGPAIGGAVKTSCRLLTFCILVMLSTSDV